MIYKIKNGKIIVTDKSQFNPEHILECGQVFRFGKDENNNYFVMSKNHKATIIETNTNYEIICDDVNYFINYFDLETDYNIAKTHLSKFEILKPMIEFGYGIRILNGDPLEMIFSYTISQNNNIKRIQQIIERLCELSLSKISPKHFPTIEELNAAPLSFYSSLGAGYRDKFLKDLSESLLNVDLNEISKLSTDELYNYLLSFKGIGPKVASCILLFGFSRREKFPVDTWLEQVYYNHFSKEKRTRPEIQKYFENEFGEFSGIAQQYLFYYERSKKTQKNKGWALIFILINK